MHERDARSDRAARATETGRRENGRRGARITDRCWADSGGSQIAIFYALRGEPDKLFEWLDRACAARDTGALFIPLTDPFLLRYRSDPRFEAYLRKGGFPVTGVR